jgi:hypothetical protein
MVGGMYGAAQGPSGKTFPVEQLAAAAYAQPAKANKRRSRIGFWVAIALMLAVLALVLAGALGAFSPSPLRSAPEFSQITPIGLTFRG